MNNNLPVIKEDGNIFTKIKVFFKTLFKLNGEKRYAVSGYKYEFGPLGCGVH